MADKFLLNDGTSRILLNDGTSLLLMNDVATDVFIEGLSRIETGQVAMTAASLGGVIQE